MNILNTQDSSFTQPISTIGGTSDNWNSNYTTTNTYSAYFAPPGQLIFETTGNLSPFAAGGLVEVTGLYALNTRQEVCFYEYGSLSPQVISLTGNLYRGNLNIGGQFYVPGPRDITVRNLHGLQGTVFFQSTVLSGAAIQNPFNGIEGPVKNLRFPDLKYCENLAIGNCRGLTALEFPELEIVDSTYARTVGGYNSNLGISFGGGLGSTFFVCPTELSVIEFPKLKYVNTTNSGGINIGGYYSSGPASSNFTTNLTDVRFPLLSTVVAINIGNVQNTNTLYYNLTSLNFNELRRVTWGSINLHRVGLSAVNFPNLIAFTGGGGNVAGSFVFSELRNLLEVNAPRLEVVGGYGVTATNCPNLTGIYFNNLKIFRLVGSTTYSSTRQLSALYLGENTLEYFLPGAGLTCNQRLSQESVDSVLKAFARLDGSAGRSIFDTGETLSLAGENKTPSYTGGVTTSSAGTNFTRTGTTVTANVVGHGHSNGDIVTFTGNTTSALNGTYVVTVVTVDQFQYTTTTSGAATGGGTVTMRKTTVATDGFRAYQTIALRGATITINFP